jgi:hypothetical protein
MGPGTSARTRRQYEWSDHLFVYYVHNMMKMVLMCFRSSTLRTGQWRSRALPDPTHPLPCCRVFTRLLVFSLY